MEKLEQPKSSSEPENKIRETVLRDIETGEGLLADALNTWGRAFYCGPDNIERLEPIPTYEERLRSHTVSAPNADFILEHSDPNKVKQYNELVARFNEDLERIKEERDYKTAKQLAQQAYELIGRKF